MRRIVAQFLLLRFFGIFVFVLFTLTSLLVLFDLLSHADDIAVHHENTFIPMTWYAALRLPVLLSMITPMSVLLAALVTFERLASQFEFVALQSAGISAYQVCGVLLTGGLLICGMHFSVMKYAATPAEARLFRWAERNYEGLPGPRILEPGAAWFSTGRYRVNIANAHEGGKTLDHVAVIETAQPGAITTYFEAAQARFEGPDWILYNGWQRPIEGGKRIDFERLPMRISLTPDQVVQVRLPVATLDTRTLHELSTQTAGTAPSSSDHYKTWWGRRHAEPLGSLVMILLATPLALQLRRSGRQLFWGSIAVALGFLFFISERIMLAFGQSGTVTPEIAVWSSLAFFSVLGLVTLIRLQK